MLYLLLDDRVGPGRFVHGVGEGLPPDCVDRVAVGFLDHLDGYVDRVAPGFVDRVAAVC